MCVFSSAKMTFFCDNTDLVNKFKIIMIDVIIFFGFLSVIAEILLLFLIWFALMQMAGLDLHSNNNSTWVNAPFNFKCESFEV